MSIFMNDNTCVIYLGNAISRAMESYRHHW